MRSAIGAIDAPGRRRMVVGKLTAGLAHHAHIGVVQTPTRADAVEKNADLDSSPRPLAKRVPELAAQFIGMKDVTGEVHRLPRGADGLEHGGEVFVAVGEQGDLVARDQNRIGERQGRSQELRRVHGETMLETILKRVTPNEKQAENKDDGEKSETEPDPFRDSESPPAVMQPM